MSVSYDAANDSKLPAGPWLPAAAQVAWWLARPVSLLHTFRRRYGKTFTMRLVGAPPLVVFSEPDAVREIFIGDPHDMHAGEANAVLEPLVGVNSLLLLDGDRHLAERKLLLPPFHGQRMLGYGEVMKQLADADIDHWPVGRPFAVHEHLQSVTLDIIIRTVFGMDGGSTVTRLRELLTHTLDVISNPLWLLPFLQVDLGRLTPWAELTRMSEEIDEVLFAEFRRRRAEGCDGRDDILSMLMQARYEDGTGLSDQQLRDEMMTLLVAGHETTTTAMAWTLGLILQHPEVRAEIARERREVCGDGELDAQAIGKMKYLDAVVREGLRLKPVLPMVGRVLQRPMRIGGIDLPAGVMAVPSIYLTHYNPDVWPDPERFEPRRFLERKVTPYEWLPFGGGVRRCIGMAFALFEMRIVLAQVLDRVDLALAPGYSPRLVRRAITFAPSKGLPVLARAVRPTRQVATAAA